MSQYCTAERLRSTIRKLIDKHGRDILAAKIGVKPFALTEARTGFISPVIVEWLGYEPVKDRYQRRKS